MIVDIDEMKKYLRVDDDDEDELIEGLIKQSITITAEVSRRTEDEVIYLKNEKTAVLFCTAYLFSHREDSDFKRLKNTIRAILNDERKVSF